MANPPSPQFCRTDETGQITSKEAPKRFSTRVSKYFRYCRPDHQMFPRNFFHVYCLTLVSVNKSRPNSDCEGGKTSELQKLIFCVFVYLWEMHEVGIINWILVRLSCPLFQISDSSAANYTMGVFFPTISAKAMRIISRRTCPNFLSLVCQALLTLSIQL